MTPEDTIRTGSPSPVNRNTDIDFERLKTSFSEQRCRKQGEDCSTQAVLARDYLNLRLGAFDVYWPREALQKPDDGEACARLLAGLAQLQSDLVGWLHLEPESMASIEADLAAVSAWLTGTKPAEFVKAAASDQASLVAAAKAPDPVVLALGRLAEVLVDRERLGIAPQFVENVGLVICTERLQFMEWIGHLGTEDADWKATHWNEGANDWTQFWKGPTMFLALEYAPFAGFDSSFNTSMPPEKLDRDGRRQHVLNQAARALLFRWFNQPDFAPLERALAANLVIGISGRIAVLDGEGMIRSSGGTTAPYSRFVPGGMSSGGVLPPAPAGGLDQIVTSRWREGKGEDYFVGALRKGQKEGAKLAAKDRDNPLRDDKRVHFTIDSDTSGAKWLAHAPFLGPYASEQAYPAPEFLNDYREFFKSYQSAFYHWLVTEAEPPDGSRGEAFSRFLRMLGTPEYAGTVGDALEEAYGLPISGPDGSADSLEFRFLTWLEQKK
ncbi:MAG TPA: hypothetical protein VMT18_07855 [Planctomycetota bacterium]|nr:hypothetical protein [Planctomycetota bacterium]